MCMCGGEDLLLLTTTTILLSSSVTARGCKNSGAGGDGTTKPYAHKNKNPKMPLFRIMRHSGNANFHKAWYTAK